MIKHDWRRDDANYRLELSINESVARARLLANDECWTPLTDWQKCDPTSGLVTFDLADPPPDPPEAS